ncbi:hypothetical protein [Actinoplanes sp. NPDC049599]|uniref:hypothetical protein n=1 Tax=Actinoplanes sp. NPDC049599 TaxID=3363903 RepID=UPI0037A3FEAB
MTEQGWDSTGLAVAEYTNLRAEVIKLLELQFQNTAVTVVAFGTVLSVGIQTRQAAIVLVYPMLALTLGIIWLHQAHLVGRIARYIRNSLEDRVGSNNLNWEHFVQVSPLPRGRIIVTLPHSWLAFWGVRSIFAASSLLALMVSLPLATWGPATITLYVLSVGATVTNVLIFSGWREPSPEDAGNNSKQT